MSKYLTWKQLSRFAGKDLWIKIYNYADEYPYYIKVNSVTRNLVRYTGIAADALEHPYYSVEFAIREYSEDPCYISIVNPLQVYSTEELTEILDENVIPY